jgi:predicted nucleic acid-binding protein
VTAVLLDSQGLSLLLEEDSRMIALLAASRRDGIPVVVSPLTIVEGTPPRSAAARVRWVLSQLSLEPVSGDDALTAVQLLRAAGGLAGHSHAIDALLAALALRLPAPVTVVTSDPGDWRTLADGKVGLIVV